RGLVDGCDDVDGRVFVGPGNGVGPLWQRGWSASPFGSWESVCSQAFRSALRRNGIDCSMSRKGNC
ncbi:MAG: hypothetical protein WBH50_12495, partial [Fuerstiella sp.]